MICIQFNTCKLFPPIKAYRKFLKIVITIAARSKKCFQSTEKWKTWLAYSRQQQQKNRLLMVGSIKCINIKWNDGNPISQKKKKNIFNTYIHYTYMDIIMNLHCSCCCYRHCRRVSFIWFHWIFCFLLLRFIIWLSVCLMLFYCVLFHVVAVAAVASLIQSFVIFIFDFIPFSHSHFYCSIVSIEGIDDAIRSNNNKRTSILSLSLYVYFCVYMSIASTEHLCSADENETDVHAWHTHTFAHHTISSKTKKGKETSESDNKVWFDYLIDLLENFLCILLHQLTMAPLLKISHMCMCVGERAGVSASVRVSLCVCELVL